MVPLHHAAVSLRLAGLDQLTAVVGEVELKAVLRGDGRTDLSILQCLKLPKISASAYHSKQQTGNNVPVSLGLRPPGCLGSPEE